MRHGVKLVLPAHQLDMRAHRGRSAGLVAEHDRVVVAIMRGDKTGAAAAMRAHIELVRDEYELYAVTHP